MSKGALQAFYFPPTGEYGTKTAPRQLTPTYPMQQRWGMREATVGEQTKSTS